jgi:hypothetical protein
MVEAPRTGVNAGHFGIQVASTGDVAQAWARFRKAGLKARTGDTTECCYALQDRYSERLEDAAKVVAAQLAPKAMEHEK